MGGVIKLARLLLVLAALAAFVMAVMPEPPQPPFLASDKLQHMAAFAVLAALSVMAFPSVSPIVPFIGLAAFGGMIEIVQQVPVFHRDGDWLDWCADLAASAVVLIVIAILRRSRKPVPVDR